MLLRESEVISQLIWDVLNDLKVSPKRNCFYLMFNPRENDLSNGVYSIQNVGLTYVSINWLWLNKMRYT